MSIIMDSIAKRIYDKQFQTSHRSKTMMIFVPNDTAIDFLQDEEVIKHLHPPQSQTCIIDIGFVGYLLGLPVYTNAFLSTEAIAGETFKAWTEQRAEGEVFSLIDDTECFIFRGFEGQL